MAIQKIDLNCLINLKMTLTHKVILTYKVGSEGLNLTEATHCICIEPWWTNAVHNQPKQDFGEQVN